MNNKFIMGIFLLITLMVVGCAPIDHEDLDFDWGVDLEDVDWESVDWSSVEWEYVDFGAINWDFVDFDAVDWSYFEWTSVDWEDADLENFDWGSVDWEQVNWDNFDWRIFELEIIDFDAVDWSFVDYEGYAEYLGINLDDYEFQEWEFSIFYTHTGEGMVNPEGERPFNITEVLFKQAIPAEGWEFEGWYLYVTDFEVEAVEVHEELAYVTSEEGINNIKSGEYDYAFLVENQEDLLNKIIELIEIQQELVQDTDVEVRGDFETIFLIAHFTEIEEDPDPEGCLSDDDCGVILNGTYVCEENMCVVYCDDGFVFDEDVVECIVEDPDPEGCLSDDDCDEGVCDVDNNVCVGCLIDDDCVEGYVCENNICEEIAGPAIIKNYFVNITKSGEGIITPEQGEYELEEGTMLLLNATPNTGWDFTAWYVYDLESEEDPVEIEDSSFEIEILFNKSIEAEFTKQGTTSSKRSSSRGSTTTKEENETDSGPLIFVYPDWMLQGRGTALDKEPEPAPKPAPKPDPEPKPAPKPDPVQEVEEPKKSFFEENLLLVIISSVFVLGGAGAFIYEYNLRKK